MSFTDLSNIAQQYGQQRPQPQPQPGQQPQDPNAPGGPPPDPRGFALSQTNPASRAFQQAAGIPNVDPTRSGNEAADLENTGAGQKKPDEEPQSEPIAFAPAIYRRPTDNRGPAGWGQEWSPVTMALAYPGLAPTADLPSPKEGYKETQQAGAYLARFAAPEVAGPAHEASLLASPLAALLDAFSKGMFSHNYTAAAMRGIQIRQAQMQMAQQQTVDAHRAFLMGVAPIFNKIAAGDPEGEQELRDYLQQHNHQYLIGMLNNHDVKGVANALDVEDQQMRRIWGAHTQISKATQGVQEEERAAAAYGHAAEGGGGGFGSMNLPGRGGRQEQAQADTSTLSDFDKELMARSPGQLTPQDMEAAHRRLMGQNDVFPIPTGGPTDYRIAQQHAALDHQMRGIVGDQSYDPNLGIQAAIDDKLRRLAGVDRGLPRVLNDMIQYRTDPKSEEGKRWVALAQQLDQRYDPGNFANAHKWYDQNSNERKVVSRIADIPQSYLTVLDNLKNYGEDDSVFQNKLQQFIAGTLGNDDKFKIQFDALFDLDQHFQAVAALAGAPRVTPLMKQLENLGSSATPMQVRGVINVNLRSSNQILHNYQKDFEDSTHRHELLPGMNAHNQRVIRDLLRINTKTGEVPSDAQPEVLAVGRSAKEARSDLKDEEKLPPLTMPQIWQLNDKYKEMAASDDPDLRAQAQEILRRIGPIIGITEHIPGVDPDASGPGSRQAPLRQPPAARR